ncbi:tetratricopeptide repeat protein [Streptomyces somaliensis]|uniref:tetratricopeptide repeat protein n=1 Tax=Streptomyces somaliensis TaxID=78355 RepID=UPI003FD871E1
MRPWSAPGTRWTSAPGSKGPTTRTRSRLAASSPAPTGPPVTWRRPPPLHQRNLADHERVHGPDHPDTLVARANLAYLHALRGEPARARDLHRQNLTDMQRLHGPDHPHTINARANLARLPPRHGQPGNSHRPLPPGRRRLRTGLRAGPLRDDHRPQQPRLRPPARRRHRRGHRPLREGAGRPRAPLRPRPPPHRTRPPTPRPNPPAGSLNAPARPAITSNRDVGTSFNAWSGGFVVDRGSRSAPRRRPCPRPAAGPVRAVPVLPPGRGPVPADRLPRAQKRSISWPAGIS